MFEITNEDGNARTGILKTAHGKVHTPCFMPVATKLSVKNISPDELEQMNAEAIIANAFIISLRPGVKLVHNYGGIHKYMNWHKCIFTDSGGFQVLSESFLESLSDKGIKFKDPFSGKRSIFTPEDSTAIQNELGSDVAMALDDVPHYGKSYDYILSSMKRTHEWAERCKKAHNNDKQLLFGIAQGGTFKELRKLSAEKINELDFDGIALGGLCIGESRKEMYDAINAQVPYLDKNKPRYLMGVGSPPDLLDAISHGIDIFDSVYPTQNARRGSLFTSNGIIKIRGARYKEDFTPIEEGCKCYTCRNFTKSYINCQLGVKENFGLRLATIHNLHFIQNLMKRAREEIENNTFEKFRQEFMKQFPLPKTNSSRFTVGKEGNGKLDK